MGLPDFVYLEAIGDAVKYEIYIVTYKVISVQTITPYSHCMIVQYTSAVSNNHRLRMYSLIESPTANSRRGRHNQAIVNRQFEIVEVST